MRCFRLSGVVLLLLTQVAWGAVIEIQTLVALKGSAAGANTNVNVEGAKTVGDGGGGEFVQIGDNASSSCLHAPETNDDGVVIVETDVPHKCWYRQFSGPVHLPWYGVPDVGNPASNCYQTGFPASTCDATTAVNAAFKAAAVGMGLGGDGGVTTDGRSIAILSHCGGCIDTSSGISIPQDQYLTCAGPQGARRDWTTDPWLPPYPPRTMLENLLQANVMEFSSSHKSTTVETAV